MLTSGMPTFGNVNMAPRIRFKAEARVSYGLATEHEPETGTNLEVVGRSRSTPRGALSVICRHLKSKSATPNLYLASR